MTLRAGFHDLPDYSPADGVLTGIIISSPADNAALARINGVDVMVRIPSGMTLAVNNPVLIARHGANRFVVARIAPPPTTTAMVSGDAFTPPSDDAPSPNPSSVLGSLVCAPQTTGTYRDGIWRSDLNDAPDSTDLIQGVWPGFGQNIGAAYYGTTPRTISGTTVQSAVLHLRRLSGGATISESPTLVLLSQSTRPSGTPTVNESITGPLLDIDETTDSFALPASWGQALVDGTRGGIGVYVNADTPYMRLAGKGSWGPAFVLNLTWKRG